MSEVKNKLAEKANTSVQRKEPKSIKGWILAMRPQIEKALPSVITADRFSRMALTAIQTNPQLVDCTPESFCGAMMQAAQLGLEPNTPLGQAYLIPFKNGKKNVTEAQFQLGYKGLISLAHRSGDFRNIEAHTVFEGDDFEYEYGLEPKLYHKPALTNRGEPIAYYAVYNLVNGGFGFEVMSHEDVVAHRSRYSKARGFSPWESAFDEMAKKTVLKKVLKYAPISVEFQKGVAADNTIKTEIAEDMVDMPAQEIEVEIVDEETGEINE